MFLKSLTLKGFKSFADPATLQMEPGVTVVVGPNGSGKSNVVDAVAWVLGAQGPRTVRSSKMEDVIFAGSADRPALGRAEVSLTIDNRAGRLPGGLAEITITRTLFRSGDSEYAMNGQPCRLLDVQELLSDSGVGRQQHVIVSQGQLDQILNARPEDRRAVIEEAAGVLKHRRRRERAERRLAATEENLDRLGDLLREVRRQIKPLERQAAAARSHAALAEELRGLRLFLVGREIADLDERRRRGASERDRLRDEQQQLRAGMAEVEAATDAAAAELSARREEDLVVALTRVQGLSERCRGLGGVLVERRRSLQRALEAAADVNVVSTLEADAARLASDLSALDEEEAGLDPARRELADSQRQLGDDEQRHLAHFGDGSEARAAEEAQAVASGQVSPLRAAVERDEASLARSDERLHAIDNRRRAVEDEGRNIESDLEALETRGATSRAALTSASDDADQARRALAEAERDFRHAEALRNRSEARSEALAKASRQAAGAAGAEALSGASGVVGVLADLVAVDDGWAGAFEAAVGPTGAAVVVEGVDQARRALSRLRDDNIAGAVVSLGAPAAGTAMTAGGGPDRDGRSLRRHVRARFPALDGLLDRLLAGVQVAGHWGEAVDLWLAHPELTVVTEAGDRLSEAGWVVHAGGAQAARAAADEAARTAAEAASAATEASTRLDAARALSEEKASARSDLARDAERSGDKAETMRASRMRLDAEMAMLESERADCVRHRQTVSERFERDAAALADLERRLDELAVQADSARAQQADEKAARRVLDERRAEMEQTSRQLDRLVATLSERRSVLSARSAEVERRLAGHVAERAQAGDRRRAIEREMNVVEALGAVLEQTGERLGAVLEGLQEQRARQMDEVRAGGERLEALRRRRSEIDSLLGASRDRLQALELELAESGVRHESAVEALRRELGVEPEQAMRAPCPELPEGTTAPARALELSNELAALGPVNPLALEELGGLEERHRFLEDQVDDVRRSRRELQQLIREVDDEIMRVFTEAFADVNAHFQILVATLFPGGTGRLTLSEPQDLLDTGVEVEARPAGKNVRKLSLLSGGERSLVALAFLFAVFRSRPSPFYLLDEVEAALDDVNLHRFLDLLHEFRDEAQLIIVSHQKRTMEAADALYGVTMTPGGSSKVVSQKVRRAAPDEEPAAAAG